MNFEIKVNDKLFLKLPKLEDAESVFSVIDKDREHLKNWLVWIDKTVSVKDTENNIIARIKEFEDKKAAFFYVSYENKCIGSAGFVSLDNVNKNGEIAYWLIPEFEGRGIITDCVRVLIKYGFTELGLHHIKITCNSENIKSVAIPKRLGFTLEGTLRQESFRNGDYNDMLIFGLLKSEWDAQLVE
jgi:ribosomal-protein-serine acetyltransferase